MPSVRIATARISVLAAGLLLAAASARAQVATYDRTIDATGYSRRLDLALDGTILGTEGNYVRKFSLGWSVLLELYNPHPGSQPGEFEWAIGSVQLPDGRLVVADAGGRDYSSGEWVGARFAVFSADGQWLAHWPFASGTAWSSPKLGSNGDFYIAVQNSGVTTIQRWSGAGSMVSSWPVSTTGTALAIRDGVLYLAGDAAAKIFKFSLDGTPLGTLTPSRIGTVHSIAVDGAGRIYQLIAASNATYLALLAPNGSRIAVQSELGSAIWAAPSDLLLVDDSKLYIADVSWGYGGIHELTVTAEVVPARSTSWGRVKAIYR